MIRLLCSCLLAGMALLGAGETQPRIAFDELRSNGALLIRPCSLALGKGTLRLSEGYALSLQEGERPLGLYFQGKGELVYRMDEDDEAAAARYNLEKNTKAKLEREGSRWFVKIPIRELALFQENAALPELTGERASDRVSELTAAYQAFRNSQFLPGAQNRSHLLLSARHAESRPEAFILECSGPFGAWQLLRDPITQQVDALNFLRRRSSREGGGDIQDFVVTPISETPVRGGFRTPIRHPFALTHLDLDLSCGPRDQARYSAREVLMPRVSGLKALRLELDNERHEVSPTRRIVSKPLLLKGVFLDERPLPFDHREHELLVLLPEPTIAGQPLKLRFEVEGEFLIRPDGDNRWELGLEPWFPMPGMNSQAFTVHAKVRVPKPFIPLMGGKTLVRREEGESNFLETEFTRPVQGFVVTAGRYRITEEVRDKLTLRIANYAMEGANDKKLLNLAFEIIKFYEGFLGPFPYPEFNIVQRNDWGEGQAPAGFLFITNEAFNPNLTLVSQLYSRGINHRFAHEIAHQYWGNNVMIASEAENWVSESFSHYTSALFLRSAKGSSEFDRVMVDMHLQAQKRAEWATIPTAHRIRNAGDHLDAFRIYQGLVYCKGAVLLHSLHQEMGDQAFATFLKSFQTSLRGRFGTSQDVVNLVRLVSKKEVGALFENCFWALGMPEYRPMP